MAAETVEKAKKDDKKDDKKVKKSVKKALAKAKKVVIPKGKVIDTMKTMAKRTVLRRLILRAEKITGKKLNKKKRFALIMHIHKVLLAKRKAMKVRVAHNIKDIYVEAKVAMKDQEKNLHALAKEKQAFMLKQFIATETKKFNIAMKAWKKKNPMKGYHVYRAIKLAQLKDAFRKKKYALKNWAANYVKAGHLKVKRNAVLAIKKDKNDIMVALRKYMYGLRQRLIDIKFGKFKRCSVKRARRIARGLERQIMAAVGKIIKPKNSACRKAADTAATIVSKRLANKLREVIAAGVVDRMGNA
jgi:hypothetical protein